MAGPSACGGLRQDLLHQWRQGFPIEHSPFQAVARRTGGSLREVLGHCQALAEAGALDMIRVRWSPRLERVRWRCSLAEVRGDVPALVDTLRSLPGVTECVLAASGAPALWFDIAAHDEAGAAAQRAVFETRHAAVDTLVLQNHPGMAGACGDGPCSRSDLAGRCERGLPLVAHPYEVLAAEQRSSEREVLGTLRRWQRCGALRTLALAPPQGESESGGAVAWIDAGDAADDERLQALARRLQGCSGVSAIERLPHHDAWPGRLMLYAPGLPQQACRQLERALAAVPGALHRITAVRRLKLRGEALLFARLSS